MGFGRKNDQESTTNRSRLQFIGRHNVIEAYRHNFGLPKDHPEVQPIVAVSGIGGVGKSRLLDQLMLVSPSETIYSRVDATDKIGDDITLLLQAIARNAKLAGRPVQFQHTSELMRRRRELIDKVTQGSPDVPKAISDLLFNGARLTAELAGGSIAGNLVDMVAPREAATQLLDTMFDRLAKLRQDKEARLLLEEPVRVLTKAFVEDLNDLGSSRYTIVLVFDDYEALAQQVNPWLLKFLLGEYRDDIQCDLRLLIAGRDPLVSTDIRWHDIWRTEGLLYEVTLEPFTDEELREFLQVNCGISDPKAIAQVAEVTSRLPLWVALWAASGSKLAKDRGGEELVAVAERILRWLPSQKERTWVELASCCKWLDEDVLAVILGRDEAKLAFSWLLSHSSLLQPHQQKWRTHNVVGEVVSEMVRRRSLATWREWNSAIAGHFRILAEQTLEPQDDIATKYESADWRQYVLDYHFYLLRASGQDQTTVDLVFGTFVEALAYERTLLAGIVEACHASAEGSTRYNALSESYEALVERRWEDFERALQTTREQGNLTAHQEAILLNWIGYSYAQRQQWAQALEWYEMSHGIDKTYSMVMHDMSNVLFLTGQVEAALSAYAEAVRLERSQLQWRQRNLKREAEYDDLLTRAYSNDIKDKLRTDIRFRRSAGLGLTNYALGLERADAIVDFAEALSSAEGLAHLIGAIYAQEFGSAPLGEKLERDLAALLKKQPNLGEQLEKLVREKAADLSAGKKKYRNIRRR